MVRVVVVPGVVGTGCGAYTGGTPWYGSGDTSRRVLNPQFGKNKGKTVEFREFPVKSVSRSATNDHFSPSGTPPLGCIGVSYGSKVHVGPG